MPAFLKPYFLLVDTCFIGRYLIFCFPLLSCASDDTSAPTDNSVTRFSISPISSAKVINTSNRFIVKLTTDASKHNNSEQLRQSTLQQWELTTGLTIKAIPPTELLASQHTPKHAKICTLMCS